MTTPFEAKNDDPDLNESFAEGVQDAEPQSEEEADFIWRLTLRNPELVDLELGPALNDFANSVEAGGTIVTRQIGEGLVALGMRYMNSVVPGEEEALAALDAAAAEAADNEDEENKDA